MDTAMRTHNGGGFYSCLGNLGKTHQKCWAKSEGGVLYIARAHVKNVEE